MNSKKSAMAFSIRFWALVLTALLIYQFSNDVYADKCKFEKSIDKTLDVSGSDTLTISASAGDLDITGVAGTGEAVISGRVCASRQDWLDQAAVNTSSGSRATIETSLPNSDGGWSSWGSNYVWMDLKIEVPYDLALEINDSSGDMFLANIAEVQIKDSSGNIDIRGARGPVNINDSSGDIEVNKADGDLTIESDSSGDIEATEIYGTVLVIKDSSGDIEVSNVSEDFVVERDSSGDISAEDVGGDFRVLKDGSGRISSNGVKGVVEIPAKD